MRRVFLMLISLVAVVAAYPSEATPALCPEPQKYDISRTEYIPYELVSIVCADVAAPDWAKRHLKQWYGKYAPRVNVTTGDVASMADEEYRIEVDARGVTVTAKSLQGVRYALYTLRQLAIPSRGTEKVEGWIVPKAKIEDKPAMEFRGIHICWFRENKVWEIERLIRLAAYYKLNYAVVETWGAYQSKVAPWWGWDEGKMTIKEVKRLKALADDLGITLIPQLNVFGHASCARVGTGKHAAIDVRPEYQPYFEPLAGWNWCLSNPNTKILQKALIKEMYEAFGCPPYFHIGGDEANLPSCPDCSSQPYSKLFLEHIEAMNETISSLGARTMMWHDMLIERGDPRWSGYVVNGTKETAEGFLKFPRDIIICDWYYGAPRPSYPSMDYFKSQGFSVLACPWNVTNGTIAQCKYAHNAGIMGVLGTTWHHYFGRDMWTIYYTLSNMMWNPNVNIHTGETNMLRVQTHIRQIGWDMKMKNPRQAGLYYDEIPAEPFLNY